MTPKQALQILDAVTALSPINRTDQQNTQIALNILAAYIESHEKAPEPPAPATDPNEAQTEAQAE